MKKTVWAVMTCTPLSGLSLAAETTHTAPWSADVSLTYVLNNGNTKSETLGGKAKGVHDSPVWRTTSKLEGLNQSDETGRIGERYFASIKQDRKSSEDAYLFLLLEHEDDRFSGYHYQTSTSVGYGYTFIKNEAHKLSAEVGPGYRRSEVEAGDALQEETFLHTALDYKWQLSPSTKLIEELSVDVGDSTLSKSATQLKTKINSRFALTLGYDVKHKSEVPVGVKNSDSITYVSLDYSY